MTNQIADMPENFDPKKRAEILKSRLFGFYPSVLGQMASSKVARSK
jgi:hypothetical protein